MDEVTLPPLIEIAAALRVVTETLALEISTPKDRPPAWNGFEWRIARAVAAMQGISSLLDCGLRWSGPAGWRRFLEEQRRHIEGRHGKIAELLQRIDVQARGAGVALVALKGAALHSCGIYRPGERPMADVDLLARAGDVEATTRLLEGCGFELTLTTWRNRLFEPHAVKIFDSVRLGEDTDHPIKIEVHTEIRERLPISETDISRFIFPAAAHPGLNAYPSMVALMMHLLLHAAGNMRANALRLIQLHDIALLAARLGAADWDELSAACPNDRPLWWAVPPLLLTARYYPAAIPAAVIERLSAVCPWWLLRAARRQRLTDVSWSNIRVHALPGVAWSQSAPEAVRFAISRVWPSRYDRFELRHFASHHPGASDVPWYGISQGARILRWIVSKPPRVQTLLSVRAALAAGSEADVDER